MCECSRSLSLPDSETGCILEKKLLGRNRRTELLRRLCVGDWARIACSSALRAGRDIKEWVPAASCMCESLSSLAVLLRIFGTLAVVCAWFLKG
eukprot:6474311-Amphidinium_carterae.1